MLYVLLLLLLLLLIFKVSPPNTRTIKTLAACLTGRWVLTPQWIEDSYAKGNWVEENLYGK